MRGIVGIKETLTEFMTDRHLSLEQLSEDLGVSVFAILKWKNSEKDIKLRNLIKLADYFDCSLEYLCGRSDILCDYTPKPCPPFSQWIKTLLAECGQTSYKLFKHTDIRPSQYHNWRSGRSEPLLSSLETVADFLGITLDYTVGRDRNG